MFYFFGSFFRLFFRLAGWKVHGDLPPGVNKAILVAGGHTSNWDFVYSVATLHTLNRKFNFIIKKEALVFPIKNLLLSLGAIPVDRNPKVKTNYVDQMVEMFKSREKLFLCIAPEGTRNPVAKWKTGYFHIAKKANVPLVLCYLDAPSKTVHIDKMIWPKETPEATMECMRAVFVKARPVEPKNFIL